MRQLPPLPSTRRLGPVAGTRLTQPGGGEWARIGTIESTITGTDCTGATAPCATIGAPEGATTDRLSAGAELPPQTTSAVKPLPEGCKGKLQGEVWATRTQACAWYQVPYVVWVPQSNGTLKRAGGATLHAWFYAYTSATSRTWNHQVQIEARNIDGDLVTGSSVYGIAGCTIVQNSASGACNFISESFPTQYITELGTWITAEAKYEFLTTNPSKAQPKWSVMIQPQGGLGQTWSIALEGAHVRCDNTITNRKAGCVIPAFTPTKLYSRSAHPNFAKHVEAAQASGLPGKTAPLHRLIDSALREKNGNTACPRGVSWLPRPGAGTPDAYECDEYPFRSTYEGAWTWYMPTDPEAEAAIKRMGRTHPWCQVTFPYVPRQTGPNGFSICMIPGEENGDAGNELGEFYADQRALDRDKFFVKFIS